MEGGMLLVYMALLLNALSFSGVPKTPRLKNFDRASKKGLMNFFCFEKSSLNPFWNSMFHVRARKVRCATAFWTPSKNPGGA
jgi:hypothetical protein